MFSSHFCISKRKVLLLKIGDSCCTFGFSDVDLGRFSAKKLLQTATKVKLISKPAPNRIFNPFPANICILKLFFLMIFAVKMSVDNKTMGYSISLNVNVGNHFNSLFLAEFEFQNSNVGRKVEKKCKYMSMLFLK